jgi:glycosyltransferase involved in cell wall biosynthesis
MEFFFVTENITLNFVKNNNSVYVDLEPLDFPTIQEYGYLLDRVYFTTEPVFNSIVKMLKDLKKHDIMHKINENDKIYSTLLSDKDFKLNKPFKFQQSREFRLGILIDFNLDLEKQYQASAAVKFLKELDEKLSAIYDYFAINIFTIKRFDFLEILPDIPFLNIFNIPASLDKLVECDLYVNFSELINNQFLICPEKCGQFLALFKSVEKAKKARKKPETEDLVSIILPVIYNQNYLMQSIENILMQSYKNIELIILYSAPEEISQVILTYISKDKRVILLSSESRSVAVLRNQGAIEASGKYLVFIENSDLILSYSIAALLRKIKTDPDKPALVFADIKILEKNNIVKLKSIECKLSGSDLYFKFFVSCFIISAGLVMFNKRAFKEVGMYDESLTEAYDIDLYTKIIINNNIAKLNIPVLIYRIFENRFINLNVKLFRHESDQVCQNFIDSLDLINDRFALIEGTPEKVSIQLDKEAKKILSSTYLPHYYSGIKLLNIAQSKCYKEERQEFINYLEKSIPKIIDEKYNIKTRKIRNFDRSKKIINSGLQ